MVILEAAMKGKYIFSALISLMAAGGAFMIYTSYWWIMWYAELLEPDYFENLPPDRLTVGTAFTGGIALLIVAILAYTHQFKAKTAFIVMVVLALLGLLVSL